MKRIPVQEVPCNGCVYCCQGDAIGLTDEDDVSLYKTEPHPYIDGDLMLAHKPNGDCYYLSKTGCTIHDIKPYKCQTMDCRVITKAIPYEKAKQLHNKNLLQLKVWRKGQQLLKEYGNEKPKGRRKS